MKDAFKKLGMTALAGMLGLSIAACGAAEGQTRAAVADAQQAEEAEESAWTPEVTLGAGSLQLHLDNQLGDVKAVYVKPSDSTDWPKDLTFENLSLGKGDLVELDYTPISPDTPYDFWFTMADGSGYQAKQVVFKDLGDGEIAVKLADGVVFFEYSDSTGTPISTKEAALAIKAAEDAAAEEARAKAEAEAEAAAAAAAEEESWDYYEEDYYNYDDGSSYYEDTYYVEDYSWDTGYSYSGGGASQSADGCLSDLLN